MAGDHGEALIASALFGIAIVMLVGWVFGQLVRRFREPPVIGEILAGIILGPSLLGLLPGDFTQRLFPDDIRPLLATVAQFGLLPFMFIVGMRMETGVLRTRRLSAMAISLPSIALPLGLGVALGAVLHGSHGIVDGQLVGKLEFSLFVGVAMSITAFPVLARILSDLDMLRTPIGSIALACAALDDVVAWCLLALVAAMATAGGTGSFVAICAWSALYVMTMAVVVRPTMHRLVRRLTSAGSPPAHAATVLMAGLLISAYATTKIGIHPIFGAFAFGVVMPRLPPADVGDGAALADPAERIAADWSALAKPIEQVGILLLPVFFITTGLKVDVSALTWQALLELLAICGIACGGKMIGAIVPARLIGMSRSEARTLGILVNTRGLTELIVLNVGVSLHILDSQMFTMMVIMAIFTTSLAGPLLARLPSNDSTRPRTAALR